MNETSLRECLNIISREVEENPLMSEDELYTILVKSKFFEALGYRKISVDVRSQYVIPGEGKKPDYICRDEFQNVILALEVKKPREERLEDALGQLWERYVLPLKAVYGVLTNGKRFIVYKRLGNAPEFLFDVSLKDINAKQTSDFYHALKKPDYDILLHSKVQEYFSRIEKLSLETDLAKDNFFETFKLSVDSVFGRLVIDMMALFDWTYPRSKFLNGAYSFWQKSFAREPEKVPDSWKPFLKDDNVPKFVFCLESAHALLARLMLAKACEDLKFPSIGISEFVVQKIHQYREQIPSVGYSIVLTRLLKEMRDHLVYSIFEEDIFSWWSDAFSGLGERSSGELLQEKLDERLDYFSLTIAKLLFILYKYDFSKIAGDPLGDLYQHYFDAETRKALGEFYTPEEIVDYILDAVDYRGTRTGRLLDPACGSGTFVVAALKRYLKESESIGNKHGWAPILRELCNSPKIVGLDIHPFACLIAQVRFMLELIPYFKKALEEGYPRLFYLQRIPIFRTDSLKVELFPPELQRQQQIAEDRGDILFPVALPLRIKNEQPVSANILLPSWRKIISRMLPFYNLEEYFCALQAIFDAAKSRMRVNEDDVPETTLIGHLREYLVGKDFALLASFFKPYADNILTVIRRLSQEFENGRLIKSIEDTVLAAFLKNYLRYDFVVGNPPYIRIYKIEDAQYYRDTFFSASGQFDIYVLFIERGIEWLNRHGKVGFITSNKYFATEYGENLRIFILNNCVIEQIVDISSVKVFAQAIYPAITVLRREVENIIKGKKIVNRFDKKIRIAIFKEDNLALLQELRTKWLKNQKIDNPALEITEISQGRLYDNLNFVFDVSIRPETKNILDKIEQDSVSLGDCGAIISGTTGFEQEKWRKCIQESPAENGESRKFITTHNIHPFHIDWGINVRIQKTPYEHPYVVYDPENITSGKWKLFKQQKIVIKALARTLTAAYDQEGYGIGKVYSITSFKQDPLYLLALLNSRVLDFYYKCKFVSTHLAGGYIRYNKPQLKRIPIKLPKNPAEHRYFKEIMSKAKTILERCDPTRVSKSFFVLVEEYKNSGAEFDEVKITFDRNHPQLKPILSGHPGKDFVVYPSKAESPVLFETKDKATFFILALENRMVKQNESVSVLMPRDNLAVQKLLERFRHLMRESQGVSLEKLQQDIDRLIYQLYGLNEEEKKSIEQYLMTSQLK